MITTMIATMRRRARQRSAKALKPYVAEVRADALAAFAAPHPHLRVARGRAHAAAALPPRPPPLRFAPVVVVTAAYDEAGSIGGVLEQVPRPACGVDVDTLVVDDGSVDGTSGIALEHDVYVARLDRNCGHGIALRLGYQLAPRPGGGAAVRMGERG